MVKTEWLLQLLDQFCWRIEETGAIPALGQPEPYHNPKVCLEPVLRDRSIAGTAKAELAQHAVWKRGEVQLVSGGDERLHNQISSPVSVAHRDRGVSDGDGMRNLPINSTEQIISNTLSEQRHYLLEVNPGAKFEFEKLRMSGVLDHRPIEVEKLIAQQLGNQEGRYLVRLKVAVEVIEHSPL